MNADMRDVLVTAALWLVSVVFFAVPFRDFRQLYPKPEYGWRFFAYLSAVLSFAAVSLILVYLTELPWIRAIPFGISVAGHALMAVTQGWNNLVLHQGRMRVLFASWELDGEEVGRNF